MSAPIPLLLVEDDDLVARAVTRALKISGYEVTRLACCAEAQPLLIDTPLVSSRACPTAPFLLGVFDINLGDGDGVNLAVRMLECGLVNHVVFFTATADPHSHERAARVGTLVSKTEGMSALFASLAHALTRVQLTRSGTLRRVVEPELTESGASSSTDADRIASDGS